MKKLVVLILAVFMVLVAGCGNKDTSCKFKLPSNVALNVTNSISYIIHMYPNDNAKKEWKYVESPVRNDSVIYNSTGSITIFDYPSKEHPTTEDDRKYLTSILLNLSEKFQKCGYGKILENHNIHWCQIQSMYNDDVILINYDDGCTLRALVDTQSEYKYICIDGEGDPKHKIKNNDAINKELSK